MLKIPLPASAKNGIRKLFHENRQPFIEALMHRFVLVPEGRTDGEWLRLFSLCAVNEWCAVDEKKTDTSADTLPFGTVLGIVPTHDACVVDTVAAIKEMRGGVVVLVDGDKSGDDYVTSLLKTSSPPEHIVQWPSGLEIEDVVGWVLGSDKEATQPIQTEFPTAPSSNVEIVAWLKKPTKEKGAKTDFLAHEAIASGISMSKAAKSRAQAILNVFVEFTGGKTASKLFQPDQTRSTSATFVWRIVLEP